MGGLMGGGCVTAASEPSSTPGSPSSRAGAGSDSAMGRSESMLEKRSKFAHPYQYLEQKYTHRRRILDHILASSLNIKDLASWKKERGDWSDVARMIVEYSAFTVPSILDYFWMKMKDTGGLTEQGIFRVSPNSRVISKATEMLRQQSIEDLIQLECGDFDLEMVMAQTLQASPDGLEFQNSVSRSTVVTPIALADGSASPSGAADFAEDDDAGASGSGTGDAAALYSLLDCHCWATLIKMWFRQCEMNLLGSIENDHLGNGETLIKAARDMNEIERVLFAWILDVSVTVSRERESNLMSPQNMAIIFSPCVMMPRTQDGGTTSAEDAMMDPMVMMNLMRRSQVMVKFMWACIDETAANQAAQQRDDLAGSLENSHIEDAEQSDKEEEAAEGTGQTGKDTSTQGESKTTQSLGEAAAAGADGETAEGETQSAEKVPIVTSAEERDQCTEAVFGAAVHAIEDATAEFEKAEKKRASQAAAAAAEQSEGSTLGV